MILALCGTALGGLGLDWVTHPYQDDGAIAAVIRVEPGTDPDDLSARVNGDLAELAAAPVVDRGLVTLLSFDGSGSFRTFGPRAFQVARTLELGAHDRAGVMVFGRRSRHWEPTADAKALASHLDEAQALEAAEKETRLAAFLLEAIDRAADAGAADGAALRRVIVFTDAGEESEVFSVEDVVKRATSRRVVVDAVVFARPSSHSFAEDLDRIARITRETGGSIYEVHDSQIPTLIPPAELPYVYVRTHACGDAPGALELFGPGGLHVGPTLATGLPTPCATAPPPSDAPAKLGLPSGEAPLPRPDRFSGLVCLMGMLVALAAIGLGIWRLSLREPEPRPQPRVPPPPPPPPTPDVPLEHPAAPTTPAAGVDTFPASPYARSFEHKLPETHLEVVKGVLAGTRWRFAGRKLRLGAVEEENDVVVDLPQVSGRHAVFELFPSGAVFVEDLASANGTYVDGRRLAPGERVDVSDGQRIDLSAQLSLIVRPGGHP